MACCWIPTIASINTSLYSGIPNLPNSFAGDASMYLLSNSFVTCASGNPLNGDFMIILATDLRRMSFIFASFTSRRKASQTTSTNSKSKAESSSHSCSSFAETSMFDFTSATLCVFSQRIFHRDSVSSGTRSLRRSSKGLESESSSPDEGSFLIFGESIFFFDFATLSFLPSDASVAALLEF